MSGRRSLVKALVTVTSAMLLIGLGGASVAAAQAPAAPTWTCSASALRVTLLMGSPIEPVTGNPANSPCVDSNTGVIPLVQVPSAISPLVTLSAVFARTDVLCASDDPDPNAPPVPGQPETNNDQCDAGPPITQQVVSRAGAADATINLGGLVIRARVIESTSRAFCDPATNRPAFQTDSKVVELTINDQVIEIPQNGEPVEIDVGLVRIVLNERIGSEGVAPANQTSGSIVRRALHVSLPSTGSLADVIVGESKADYSGDTCPEGKVVIKKETAPDEDPNTTDFGFTTTGGLTPDTFTLRDDGERVFDDVRPGKFSVTENAPADPYSLESIECTDATGNTTTSVPNRRADIDVRGGETVTCTFTNRKAPQGTIVVRKQTAPDEEPNATDFGFTTTGGLTPATFSLKDDGERVFTDVKPGEFTVTEDAPSAPYSLESIDCIDATGNTTTSVPNRRATIDVAGGETVTCTFTNRKAANGTVIIRKQTNPDEDPNATDFGFTTTGLTPASFSLRDDGQRIFTEVAPGTYSVTEDAPSAPYSLESIECTDATGNTTTSVPDRKADINLAAGETVTCIFTNKRTPTATIVVRKQTAPDEDPNTTDFGFTTTGGLTPATFSLKDDGVQTFSDLTAGTYSVTENAPTAGYSLETLDCVDPTNNTTTSVANRKADINVAAGELVICTFTNRKAANGTVIIRKQTTPDEDPNATDFGFTSTGGLTPATFSLKDDGERVFTDVAAGAYSVTEDAPSAPYSLDSIECTDATANTTTSVPDRKATINVAAGETVICTFTNEKAQKGTIVVKKQTAPEENPNATNFGFTSTGGLSPATFTLQDDGTRTFSDLTPGEFSVTENAGPTPYALSLIDCTDPTNNTTTSLGDRRASIDVAAGETVTCTFVNSRPAPGTVTCPPGTAPDANGNCVAQQTQCPPGTVRNPQGICVSTTTSCPPGTARNPQGQCIATNVQCPPGTTLLPGVLRCEAAPTGGAIVPLYRLPRIGPCRDRRFGAQFAIIGTNGPDRITGSNLADRIFSLGGNDRVSGGRGDDCVQGGSGRDVLDGSNGNDFLLGETGPDQISGGPGRDRLDAGSGNDRVLGDAGNDTVRGGSGRDRIRGGDGNDRLIGGSGNDGLHTGNGRDRVFGGSGNDIINAATRGPAAFVDCGPGRDRVRINNNERTRTRNCEFVDVFKRIRRPR